MTVFREIASSPAKVRIDGRRLSAAIDSAEDQVAKLVAKLAVERRARPSERSVTRSSG